MSAELELVEAFLRWKQVTEGRADNTVVKYRRYLLRLAAFLAGRGRQLRTATPEDIELFTGLHAHNEGLTPRSRRPLVACVRGFYVWLLRNGRIPESPARDIPYPLAGLKLPVAMSLANAEKMIMAPDISTFVGIRDAAMLAVLIGCGVRVSGLVGLNESQLQFVMHEGVEWLVVRVSEKGGKERLVPAPHETRLLVRAYLGHPELDQIDRTLPNGDRVLFVSVNNRRITPDKYHGEARRIATRSVHARIVYYGRKAKVPIDQLHPHAMRHLYGTELAEEDARFEHIQALLGHADNRSTQIYAKLAIRHLTNTVARANPLKKIRTPVSELVKQLSTKGR